MSLQHNTVSLLSLNLDLLIFFSIKDEYLVICLKSVMNMNDNWFLVIKTLLLKCNRYQTDKHDNKCLYIPYIYIYQIICCVCLLFCPL